MTRISPAERYAASATEAEALKAFRDFSTIHGGWFGHVGGDLSGQKFSGWPDVTILFDHCGALCAFEVKIGDDALSPEQDRVLRLLDACGAITGVVRYGRKRPGEIDQDEAFDLMRKAIAS